VWTPSGGWWCDPKGWRRNTAVAAAVFLAAQYALFRFSSANETRYVAPKGWVASMAYTDARRYPRKEGEEDDEAGEEIDALEMTGRVRAAAGTPPVRVDVSRILSPADFERIRRLKQMQQQAGARRGMTRGQKRRLAEAGDSDEDEGPVSGLALEGEAVDPMDIAGAQARKAATREQKLASTLAGREDRQQFGRRKKVKSGGTSNIEKKRTKDFRMMSKMLFSVNSPASETMPAPERLLMPGKIAR